MSTVCVVLSNQHWVIFTRADLWRQNVQNEQGRKKRSKTALGSTVGDPKLPIKILTVAHFITDPAMHRLWLQWDPHIKVIGSQKQLLQKTFIFNLRHRTLKRDSVSHNCHGGTCYHQLQMRSILILYHLQQLLCHWICKQWIIRSVPAASLRYKQKGSHINIYKYLLLKHLKPTVHAINKTEYHYVSADYSLTCFNKNLMGNGNSLSHWQ